MKCTLAQASRRRAFAVPALLGLAWPVAYDGQIWDESDNCLRVTFRNSPASPYPPQISVAFCNTKSKWGQDLFLCWQAEAESHAEEFKMFQLRWKFAVLPSYFNPWAWDWSRRKMVWRKIMETGFLCKFGNQSVWAETHTAGACCHSKQQSENSSIDGIWHRWKHFEQSHTENWNSWYCDLISFFMSQHESCFCIYILKLCINIES